MIVDSIYERVKERSPLCVGLDLRAINIPKEVDSLSISLEDKLFATAKMIVDATREVSACYKVQIACYEAFGLEGMMAYSRILKYVRSLGEIVIADIKRGDILSTAKEYAKGHFSGDFESDMVTLNPYMGVDAISPYFQYITESNKGAFILVKTSNPSSVDFQEIEDGRGQKLYSTVLEAVKSWGVDFIGNSGYSALGAVVGVNHLQEVKEIRESSKNKVFLLVPGYGKQGAKLEDIAYLIGAEKGGIVNVSRGVIDSYIGQEGDSSKIVKETAERIAKELLNA